MTAVLVVAIVLAAWVIVATILAIVTGPRVEECPVCEGWGDWACRGGCVDGWVEAP